MKCTLKSAWVVVRIGPMMGPAGVATMFALARSMRSCGSITPPLTFSFMRSSILVDEQQLVGGIELARGAGEGNLPALEPGRTALALLVDLKRHRLHHVIDDGRQRQLVQRHAEGHRQVLAFHQNGFVGLVFRQRWQDSGERGAGPDRKSVV